MDFSFLKLYDNINDCLSDNSFKDSRLNMYIPIQLSPNEVYSQQTNYDGGISFNGDYVVHIVDACGNVLKNVTEHFFIEEFTDAQGQIQCKIEIVNLGVDFYGNAVIFNFKSTTSNISYFSRPLKITDKDLNKTYRFDYWNEDNSIGLSYEASNFKQSIRLNLKFTGLNNQSDVGDYYQISKGNSISTRPLRKISQDYLFENIDTFTFNRFQEVLFHDNIYIDGKRITNKPVLSSEQRIGMTNLFKANFSAFVNEAETYKYELQIYEGLGVVKYVPFGYYNSSTLLNNIFIRFNKNVTLGSEGTISIYKVGLGLLQEYDISLFYTDGDMLRLTSLMSLPNTDGQYYFNITEGFVKALGIDNEAITDNSTWFYGLQPAEYDETEYDNNEYFT